MSTASTRAIRRLLRHVPNVSPRLLMKPRRVLAGGWSNSKQCGLLRRTGCDFQSRRLGPAYLRKSDHSETVSMTVNLWLRLCAWLCWAVAQWLDIKPDSRL